MEKIDLGNYAPPEKWKPEEPESTWGEVFEAARNSAVKATNIDSQARNIEAAYDEAIERVAGATGKRLPHPAFDVGVVRRSMAEREAEFEGAIDALIAQHPDKAEALRPGGKYVAARYHEVRRQAVEGAAQSYERYDGLPGTGTLAMLAGGVVGSFESPPEALLNVVGMRFRSGNLLRGALINGAVNAGTEAVKAPWIQSWNAQAGLPSGISHAAMDVAVAGVAGAAIDVGLRGPFRVGQYGLAKARGQDVSFADVVLEGKSPRELLAEAAAKRSPDDPVRRAVVDDDPAAQVELARSIEDKLDPSERGALRHLEDDIDAGTFRKPSDDISEAQHLDTLITTIRQLETGEPVARAVPMRPDTDLPAVRSALDQAEDPLTAAMILREFPGTRDPESHRGAWWDTAEGLSRLSDEALDTVMQGTARGDLAALVGNMVEDQARHAELVRGITAADPPSLDAARGWVREATRQPLPVDVRVAVAAPEAPARVMVEQRSAVLEGALPQMIDNPEVRAAIAGDAAQVETLLRSLTSLRGEAARMLDRAATAVQRGEDPKRVADAFAADIARTIREGGVKSLAEVDSRLSGHSPIDDPTGPDAAKQVADLERTVLIGEERAKRLEEIEKEIEGSALFAQRQRRLTIDGNRMSRRQVENDIRMWLDSAEGVRRRASKQDLTPEQKAEAESYVKQYERWAEDLRAQLPRFDQDKFPRGRPFKPATTIDAGDRFVVRRLGGLAAEDETSRTYRIYAKSEGGGEVKNLRGYLGEVSMSRHPDGRWEVDMVEVGEKHRGKGVAKALYNAVENDIGDKMRPSGILLPDGYAMWKARDPDLVKHHVPFDGVYLSPKRLLQNRDLQRHSVDVRKQWKKDLDEGKRRPSSDDEPKEVDALIADAEQRLQVYDAAIARLPPEATSPDALASMFKLKAADLYSDGFAAMADVLVRRELSQMAHMLPEGVRLNVLQPGGIGDRIDGAWHNDTSTLHIALTAMDKAATVRHELVHAYRSLGLLTDQEFGVLRAKVDEVMDAETQGLIDKEYRAAYKDRGWDDQRMTSAIDEEKVAFLVEERWRRKASFGATVDAILDRIIEVMERMRNALAGLGYQSFEDVIARMESGEVAARSRMRQQMADGVELPGGGRVSGVHLFAIKAYHGSPHDFDRFDMSKIGTGEGAQAYGHGLYFAENEGVARSYRDALGNYDDTVKWKGDQPPTPLQKELINLLSGNDATTGQMMTTQKLRSELVRARRYVSDIDDDGNMVPGKGPNARRYQELTDLLDELKRSEQFIEVTPPGRMYEVRINADPNDFLDWDKPAADQPAQVRAKLPPEWQNDIVPEYPTWTGHARTPEGMQRLREAGIPGIRYLDQGSRVAGEGSRNYVVFDDKLIEIVAKDGQPVKTSDIADSGLFSMKRDGDQDLEILAAMQGLDQPIPPARLPQQMMERGSIGDQRPDIQGRELQWKMPRQQNPDVAPPSAPANANEPTSIGAMLGNIDALGLELRADEPTRINQPPPGTASIWKTAKDAVKAQDQVLKELQQGYGATMMDSSQGLFNRLHDIAYPHPAETHRMISVVADGIRRAKPPKTPYGFGYQITDSPSTVKWMTGDDGDTLMVGTKATADDVEKAIRSKVGPDGRWKHGDIMFSLRRDTEQPVMAADGILPSGAKRYLVDNDPLTAADAVHTIARREQPLPSAKDLERAAEALKDGELKILADALGSLEKAKRWRQLWNIAEQEGAGPRAERADAERAQLSEGAEDLEIEIGDRPTLIDLEAVFRDIEQHPDEIADIVAPHVSRLPVSSKDPQYWDLPEAKAVMVMQKAAFEIQANGLNARAITEAMVKKYASYFRDPADLAFMLDAMRATVVAPSVKPMKKLSDSGMFSLRKDPEQPVMDPSLVYQAGKEMAEAVEQVGACR